MLSIILSGKKSHQMFPTKQRYMLSANFMFYFWIFLHINLSLQDCVKKTANFGGSANSKINPLTNFEISQYILSKSGSGRFSYFTMNLGFSPPQNGFEVAPIISAMEGFNDDTGIDFSIRVSKSASSFDAILTMNEKAVWQNIKMSFIVTSRQDIRAGSFIADTVPFMLPKISNKIIMTEYCLQEDRRVKSKLIKVESFITGLKTQDKNFRLTFGSSKFIKQQNKLAIQLQLSSSNQPLELLFISYVIFAIDSTFQATRISDLLVSQSNKLFIIGMASKSQIQTSTQNVRTLATPVGKSFINKGIAIDLDNQIDPNWLSNDPMPQIFKSLNSKNQCISLQTCHKLGGSFLWKTNNLSIQTYVCQFCGENQTFSSTTQTCQCLTGYSRNFTRSCQLPIKQQRLVLKSGLNLSAMCPYKIGGKCYTMGTPQLDCPQNSNLVKGVCECGPGFVFESFIKKCIINPCKDPDSQYKNGRCMCNDPNKFYSGGSCMSCQSNQVWKKQLGICACKQGTTKIGALCQPCHVDSILNKYGICVCKPGFAGNGAICRKVS